MRISDLPKQLQLQLYIELKILGIPESDESDEFPPDVKELAEVTDFWPYVEEIGFTRDEYAEILKSRSRIDKLQIEDPENLRWVDALPMGEYYLLQLGLIKKRLIQVKSEIQELEREIQRNPNNLIAIENLNYLRFSAWHLVSFMRLSSGGGLQDVPTIQDSPSSLTDAQMLSNVIAVSQDKVKKLRDTIRALQKKSRRPSREELQETMDKHRFHSGKVNLSAVGREYGKTGDTIKRWIEEDNLLSYADPGAKNN